MNDGINPPPEDVTASTILSWMSSSADALITPRPTPLWLVTTMTGSGVDASARNASKVPGRNEKSGQSFT